MKALVEFDRITNFDQYRKPAPALSRPDRDLNWSLLIFKHTLILQKTETVSECAIILIKTGAAKEAVNTFQERTKFVTYFILKNTIINIVPLPETHVVVIVDEERINS